MSDKETMSLTATQQSVAGSMTIDYDVRFDQQEARHRPQ
jgi:hypothetical protein